MKNIIFCLTLILFVIITTPAISCDCDTATSVLTGMPDRLHSPWPNDPEKLKEKEKTPENTNRLKQEVGPQNQNMQPKGEIKK